MQGRLAGLKGQATIDGHSLGKIADMYTSINASRTYVYAVARACDRGQISRRVSNNCRLECWVSDSIITRTALEQSYIPQRKQ